MGGGKKEKKLKEGREDRGIKKRKGERRNKEKKGKIPQFTFLATPVGKKA